MKVVIVGGVAGGASSAARARRLDETAEIVMLERGEFISFANCGLPYHVGNVIADRSSLMVMTPEKFKDRTNIEVRTLHEVVQINRDQKTVTVRNHHAGKDYTESYDRLILATGSSPIRPPIPGADDPDVLPLWTIPDMDRIKSRVDQGAKHAVVVGAGFLGLEIAENLRERGMAVELVEMLPQVLPTLDAEMAQPLAAELTAHGISLRLGRKVQEIHRPSCESGTSSELHVVLDDASELVCDFVVMAIGVRPNTQLAEAAGLKLAERGGVVVDKSMRTSDPHIYAVGDVVAVHDLITHSPSLIPLAGPANRQGRVAANAIFGRDAVYEGSLGTSVVKLFGMTAGSAGQTEKRLKQQGIAYRKIYVHAESHAGYYPGSATLVMKMLYSDEGRILGIQVVGEDGVDKRVDVVATAMKTGLTVYQLEDLELAYAPPYGSAKDPVNFLGMVAVNDLRGDTNPVHWDGMPKDAFILDVREPDEFELGAIEGAKLIPLGSLRQRLDEIPRENPVVAYCKIGLRGYLAERILAQNGFTAANLSGGWLTWRMGYPGPPSAAPAPLKHAAVAAAPQAPRAPEPETAVGEGRTTRTIDVSTMQCPGPIVRVRQELDELAVGDVLNVRAARSFKGDLEAWTGSAGHRLFDLKEVDGLIEARIEKGRAAAAAGQPARRDVPETAAIVVFSNDFDRVMAAFIIATGMASLGVKVSMFFTFWGLTVLRKEYAPAGRKDLLSRMFGFMLPKGPRKLALSKMHMMGMGTAMMKRVMGNKNVTNLPDLINEAKSMGVEFIACDMAMNVMGIQQQELIDGIDDVAGVAKFAALAKDSGTTLFI